MLSVRVAAADRPRKKAAPVPAASGTGGRRSSRAGGPIPRGKVLRLSKNDLLPPDAVRPRRSHPPVSGREAPRPARRSSIHPGGRASRLPRRGIRLSRRGSRPPDPGLASGGRDSAPGGETLASRGGPPPSSPLCSRPQPAPWHRLPADPEVCRPWGKNRALLSRRRVVPADTVRTYIIGVPERSKP